MCTTLGGGLGSTDAARASWFCIAGSDRQWPSVLPEHGAKSLIGGTPLSFLSLPILCYFCFAPRQQLVRHANTVADGRDGLGRLLLAPALKTVKCRPN